MVASSSDLVAAFLAKGGKVAKVETGAGVGLSGREWANAVRGVAPAIVTRVDDDDCAYEREAEAFGAARANGASVSASLDAARGYSTDSRGRYWTNRRR